LVNYAKRLFSIIGSQKQFNGNFAKLNGFSFSISISTIDRREMPCRINYCFLAADFR